MKEPKLYKCVRPIISFFFKIIYRPTIIGKENIVNESVILAGNHTSYFDCILLMSCTKKCIHFLAKDSLNKGFKKIIFSNMGIIPIDRINKNNKKSIKEAINILENKGVIGIFPEGTINRTNDIVIPFKIGAVKIAKEANALIVPFAITGKYRIFKKGIRIEFKKPYKLTSDDLDKENDKLKNVISEMIVGGNTNGIIK